MLRSDQLKPLSREHHVALELALRLRRATVADAGAVRDAALAFWDDEGREHFRLEEELLLPAFARHAGDDDPDIVRILVEHVGIRRRIADLQVAPGDAAALNALGAALGDHVRHEERVVFPRVEDALSPAELDALGTALAAAGNAHRPPRA